MKRGGEVKRWELIFPILAILFAAWATIPDLFHFCGFLEFSRTCGLGWIFRLDILLPSVAVLAVWGWVRTILLWRYLRELALIVEELVKEWEERK